MLDSKVKIGVYYIEELAGPIIDRYGEDRFYFYKSPSLPLVQGGRIPGQKSGDTANRNEIKYLVEKYGDRFRVLANSTFPTWHASVEDLCEILDLNHGSIVVSRMYFAREIRERYPNIKIHSSVIMNFYHDINSILESDLFDTVGGPQFYNDDTDKMIDIIPPIHRERLIYIINGCVWTHLCLWHYQLPSLQWKYPVLLREQWNPARDCSGRGRSNVDVRKIVGSGFKTIKLQGRVASLETAIKYLDSLIYEEKILSIGE